MFKYNAGYKAEEWANWIDRKSTRLNSSHDQISYAVFCLKKKKRYDRHGGTRAAGPWGDEGNRWRCASHGLRCVDCGCVPGGEGTGQHRAARTRLARWKPG